MQDMKVHRGSVDIAPLILIVVIGCELSASCFDRFTRYTLNRWLGGFQSRSGRFGEEEIVLSELGIELWTVPVT
jgi:hypothetical protein